MMLTAHIVDYAFMDWMKNEYTIEGVDGVYSGRELMKAGMNHFRSICWTSFRWWRDMYRFLV